MVVEDKLRLGPVSTASGPLYQQVIEAIKREIVSGRLPPGSAMPSFRVLAESLAVSLITVKRAYEELEREGIIYRRQGLGTFVADAGDERTRESHVGATQEALRTAVRAGREAGLSDRELMRLLREELQQGSTRK
jgi:GntR family transcriptional regulator